MEFASPAELDGVSTEVRVAAIRALKEKWKRDPVRFVREAYTGDPEGRPVTIDVAQDKVLHALADSDRTVVRGPRGVGKTALAAWAVHWWLSTRYPALVVTSAGTWGHLEDRLWSEIHIWGRLWLMQEAFEWQRMKIYHKEEPDAWRAIATSSDEPGNVEGFHSPNLLLLIDEAKQMPDEVFQALSGSLTQRSAEGAKPKVLILSTPPLSKAGWFVDLFGTRSRGWTGIHLTASDSTRISPQWIEEIAEQFGEESAFYKTQVLGEISDAGSDVVVPTAWIEKAQARPRLTNEQGEVVSDRKGVVLTCDVAREGQDLTVLGRIKEARWDIPVLDGRPAWRATSDLMEVAGLCTRAAVQENARVMAVDDTGLGGGVTDRLRELQREKKFPPKCVILSLKFGATADKNDRFTCKKDELWWKTRDALRQGVLTLPTDREMASYGLPRGSDLKVQLSSAIYGEGSLSRVKVWDHRESGNEKTKGLPTKSPDIAHALILGVESWLRLPPEKEVPTPPKNAEEQFSKEMRDLMKKKHRGQKRQGAWRGRQW